MIIPDIEQTYSNLAAINTKGDEAFRLLTLTGFYTDVSQPGNKHFTPATIVKFTLA